MRTLTYISLFSSAGVGCYGFKQAGFECIATCELLSQRMEIQRANNKCRYDSGYITGDISLPEIKDKLCDEISFWKKMHKIINVDVIVATPPCQGMSTANYKKGDETKRNSLVVEAITLIKKVKPRIFVLENVKSFLKTECTDIDGAIRTIGECLSGNLSNEYYIFSKVINFKDYGVPSSRPRTIVIGTRKDCVNISPLNIFPDKEREITVRDAIGEFPPLSFGEINSNDIFHMFREYPRYMENWISHILEGQSAFGNDKNFLPYKIINGEKHILKGAFMGNKFRRLLWDKPCACIATRNDQLASQSTIHPRDNRVLSIRELMRLMSIPDEFKWTSLDTSTLKTQAEKKLFLKKNELNIRRCIGEAVPTHIMHKIALKAKTILDFQDFVDSYYKNKNLQINLSYENFYINTFIAEKELSNAKTTGAYYTPQTVVFEALSSYSYIEGKTLSLLEPSVGLGAFLPQLFTLLQDCDKVDLDLCDIDNETLCRLKLFLSTLKYDDEKFNINFICDDFILCKGLKIKYDLIVSNPPFFSVTGKELATYRKTLNISKPKNIFAFFLKRFIALSNEIITILPKNFLMATEYDEVRMEIQQYGTVRIVDFGVKYFKEVFVEILSVHFKKEYTGKLSVVNKSSGEILAHPYGYIYHNKCWLIYRNKWFDEYISKLKLDVFTFFRDRQISNKFLKDCGDIRILRSKNILDNGNIISVRGYDKYIESEQLLNFAISKYLNGRVIIMPNFTYNTRATILPENCLPNGSIAVLIPKNNDENLDIDLNYYSSLEFREYYSIIKNKAKFTLNIDKNSVYYIGVKLND